MHLERFAGAAPMPCAASVTSADRSSATVIHMLIPSLPVTLTPRLNTSATNCRRRVFSSSRATTEMVGVAEHLKTLPAECGCSTGPQQPAVGDCGHDVTGAAGSRRRKSGPWLFE